MTLIQTLFLSKQLSKIYTVKHGILWGVFLFFQKNSSSKCSILCFLQRNHFSLHFNKEKVSPLNYNCQSRFRGKTEK